MSIRMKFYFHPHTNAPPCVAVAVDISIINIIKILKPRGRRGFSHGCIRPLTCKSNGCHLHKKGAKGLMVAQMASRPTIARDEDSGSTDSGNIE